MKQIKECGSHEQQAPGKSGRIIQQSALNARRIFTSDTVGRFPSPEHSEGRRTWRARKWFFLPEYIKLWVPDR